MASTTLTICGTGANDGSIGTLTWDNPGNITADDSSYAEAMYGEEGSRLTNKLRASNFGFEIPDGATIDGVEIEFDLAVYDGSPTYFSSNYLQLHDGSSYVGDDKYADVDGSAGGVKAAGADDDDWNASLTAAKVNSTGFGFAWAGRMNLYSSIYDPSLLKVNYAKIKVHYTESGAAASVSRIIIIG